MKKFVFAQRVVLGLAVAATAAAPMAASARDGWGHGNGDRRGYDRGYAYRDHGNWHRDDHYRGHGNAGAWIAGAIAVAAVAGIVQQAVAPAPTYYQPAPAYYPQAPTVVYRQPSTVVYQQQQPVDDGQVIYQQQPDDGYQSGYQGGYQGNYQDGYQGGYQGGN